MSTDLKLSRDKVSGEGIDEGSVGVNRFEGQLAGVPERAEALQRRALQGRMASDAGLETHAWFLDLGLSCFAGRGGVMCKT